MKKTKNDKPKKGNQKKIKQIGYDVMIDFVRVISSIFCYALTIHSIWKDFGNRTPEINMTMYLQLILLIVPFGIESLTNLDSRSSSKPKKLQDMRKITDLYTFTIGVILTTVIVLLMIIECNLNQVLLAIIFVVVGTFSAKSCLNFCPGFVLWVKEIMTGGNKK